MQSRPIYNRWIDIFSVLSRGTYRKFPPNVENSPEIPHQEQGSRYMYIQWIFSPVKQKNPKTFFIELSEVSSRWDDVLFKTLIEEDEYFMWDLFLSDVRRYGMQKPALVLKKSRLYENIIPCLSHIKNLSSCEKVKLTGCDSFGEDRQKELGKPVFLLNNGIRKYTIGDGNHRIRVLKELYPENTLVEVELAEGVNNKKEPVDNCGCAPKSSVDLNEFDQVEVYKNSFTNLYTKFDSSHKHYNYLLKFCKCLNSGLNEKEKAYFMSEVYEVMGIGRKKIASADPEKVVWHEDFMEFKPLF